MNSAIDAVEADRQALLDICSTLEDADWKAESGCPGWSVKDVIAHMGALFWLVVDASSLPSVEGLPTEQAQDTYVESRRSWSADRVAQDYESVSSQALVALKGLQDQTFDVPLGDVGTYPASFVANAFAFDHYTHIRADMFAPRGPLTGRAPASDELRMVPVIDWIEAALPQQNPELLAALDRSVEIRLTGPGARTITLGRGGRAAQIRSDTAAFVPWITQRSSWEAAGATAEGDLSVLGPVRQLRVF